MREQYAKESTTACLDHVTGPLSSVHIQWETLIFVVRVTIMDGRKKLIIILTFTKKIDFYY